MNQDGLFSTKPFTIVFIGNYLPRQCGIATFTADLLGAVVAEAPEMDILQGLKDYFNSSLPA